MPKFLLGAVVLVASFVGALYAMNALWPAAPPGTRPQLLPSPPLESVTRRSTIIAPMSIPLSALRDALDAQAPHNLIGRPTNPVSQLLSRAEIGWTLARSPLAIAALPAETLAITTALTGSLRATGQIAAAAGNVGGALGGLVNSGLGQQVQNLAGKTLDQRADIRGNVTLSARPTLLATWRIDPHLTAQLSMGDTTLSVVGVKVNVGTEIKPMVDKQINEQVAILENRLRNDAFLEQAARREWTKMCRAIPLGGAGTGLPALWLEVRPTRAFAAQPRVDAAAIHLVMGVQAETRITPSETTPSCPFPAKLEIVAQADDGRVNIGMPIDLPFTEVNKILERQLKSRTFPEDGSGPVEVSIRGASIAPSGDRLLISLRMNVKERKTFIGFGAEATVHIWGRPALDRERQLLRLTDLDFDVESDAALGLLGSAARAAKSQLQTALADKASIDLKPFTTDAKTKIAAAVAEFTKQDSSVKVDAAITDLRLVDIAFDATTLRVLAQAQGTVEVTLSSLRLH
jgi:Domain of unknown function (DUF4403)